jgi:hypothetical protein
MKPRLTEKLTVSTRKRDMINIIISLYISCLFPAMALISLINNPIVNHYKKMKNRTKVKPHFLFSALWQEPACSVRSPNLNAKSRSAVIETLDIAPKELYIPYLAENRGY